MSASSIRQRSTAHKSNKKSEMSDNIRNSHSSVDDKSALGSILRPLIDLDVLITSKLGLCANKSSPLGYLRPLMIFLEWTCHGVPWIAGTVAAILVSHDRTMLQLFLNFFLALMFDLLVVVILKALFQRKRPEHNVDDMIVVDAVALRIDRHSFPSGHATRAVMTALFLIDKIDFTCTIRTLIYIWMIAVPVSRVLLGRHHVLDVMAGVVCGAIQYVVVVNYLWLSEQTCMDVLQPIHEDLHL